jgi:hypothetical protein
MIVVDSKRPVARVGSLNGGFGDRFPKYDEAKFLCYGSVMAGSSGELSKSIKVLKKNIYIYTLI